MLFKKLENSRIKKILIVSLTNIGDVVLTCPTIDAVITQFPLAEVSLVVGPKARTLFDQNPYIKNIYIFTKKESWFDLFLLFKRLYCERFDLVIDLRNTALAYFLGVPFHTSVLMKKTLALHKKDQHFLRLKSVVPDAQITTKRYALFISELIRKHAESLFHPSLGWSKSYFVVSPGAADTRKRWTVDGFVAVCQALIDEYKLPILFIGDAQDKEYSERVITRLPPGVVNLCGRVSLLEAVWVLRNSHLVLCNDSAVMHLASYFDVPVVALFGPTDPRKYGPWGAKGAFVQTQSKGEHGEGFMSGIEVKDVLAKIKSIF